MVSREIGKSGAVRRRRQLWINHGVSFRFGECTQTEETIDIKIYWHNYASMNQVGFKHGFSAVMAELTKRLQEPTPARIQILTGPRQVGKTTLLLGLQKGWQERALYAAADGPEASLPDWWTLLWQKARTLAIQKGSAVLLLDEIQYVTDWSRRLKHEADRLQQDQTPLHVVVSGSSALHLGKGARETMAGRFERLRLFHWPASELNQRLGIPLQDAPRLLVTHGSYPGALLQRHDEDRYRQYVLDSIIEPAIGRDMALMESIRKPAMLRQLFAVAIGHPSEIISLQKLQGSLSESGSLVTVAHYLRLLEDSCLVAAVPKFSRHIVRQRAAPPKLVPLNNALLGSVTVKAPDQELDPIRWGRWVENACMALAWNSGQQVCYWRQEPHEVDLICDGSWGKWAIEVKTGNYTARDLSGLMEFLRRYPDFSPLVLCDPGQEEIARRAILPALSWPQFLLQGPHA